MTLARCKAWLLCTTKLKNSRVDALSAQQMSQKAAHCTESAAEYRKDCANERSASDNLELPQALEPATFIF